MKKNRRIEIVVESFWDDLRILTSVFTMDPAPRLSYDGTMLHFTPTVYNHGVTKRHPNENLLVTVDLADIVLIREACECA